MQLALHGEHELPRHLDRLDHAVRSASRHDQPISELVHSLVVEAVDDHLVADQLVQARARDGRDRMAGMVRGGQVGHGRLLEPAPVAAGRVGGMRPPGLDQAQVLHQRPAEGDVHHLHAAAGADDGQAAVDRPLDELDFEAVAGGVDRPQQRVRGLPVANGVDVVPGCQHHPVDPVELVVQPIRDAGEQHRHRPGHHQRALVADSGVVAEAVEPGRDADQRLRVRDG